MKINSLRDVFVQELRDLYSAETQLVDALPKMAEAASSSDLRTAFEQHLRQTGDHVNRLERIFNTFNLSPSGESCEAMQGLISEGKDYIGAEGDSQAKDAGLIASAQKIEHYEIASYGTVRALALRLGDSAAAELLQKTLDEEGGADKLLTSIAERHVNVEAAHSAHI